jgi:putative salt-induced outer membrane protein YdiY/small nuclear ribonucleoprotein (snRNP)-like protein
MFTSIRSFLIVSVALQLSLLFADQVTLKNGDRISGTVVKFDGKNVVLKSEFAGEVTIPWTAVTGITSTNPLNVGLKDGQVVVGTVQASESRIDVATKDTGTVSAPRDSVVFMRSNQEQAAYDAQIERYRNPRIIDLWNGFLDLGYAQSSGNADTQTFNLSANAARSTTRDKISVYFTSIYSKGTVQSTGLSVATANAKRGGIAYNLNLNKKWFGFGSVDLENDQFQALDLRFVPAGGVGYHAIALDTTTLDLQAGGAPNREFFSTGLNRTQGEALLGQVFMHKFNKITTLQEKFFYFPGFGDAGHRMNFDASLITSIRKWLGWQLSISDRYLSDPVPGFKKNDVLFTTGARLTFAK